MRCWQMTKTTRLSNKPMPERPDEAQTTLEDELNEEDKRLKSQKAAVFNWFCNNGYVPPVQSEINDLIWEVERWIKP